MKILHCADLHIREKDAEEIDRCLQAIVTTAQTETPDLCVIAGDIFDSRDVRVDSRAAMMAIGFVSALMDLAPVAIVLGTPSHDGAAPRIMQYVRGEYDVIVAEKPMQVILGEKRFKTGTYMPYDAVLTLIPQPTKQYWQGQGGVGQTDAEIGAAMSGVFAGFGAQAVEYPGVPHVLVYHGGISGAKVSTGQVLTGHDIEVSVDQLAMTGADLYCLGHIHLSQQIGDRGFYAGSPYRTNWGEMEAKGFYIHILDRGIAATEERERIHLVSGFIETPARKVVRITRNWTDSDEPIIGDGVEGAEVRVDITVWQDQAEGIDREEIRRNLIEDFGAIEVDVRITRVPHETVRAESVLKAETLRAKIEERARITGEEVPAGVLELADLIEGSKAEELLKSVVGGGV